MAQPAAAHTTYISVITLPRLFMFVAFLCFLIASLIAAGVFSPDFSFWAFGMGGFAATALAWTWTAWPR
jgi:hypothetical protein